MRAIRLVQLEVTTTSVAPKSQQKNPNVTGSIDKAGQKSALPATEEQGRTALEATINSIARPFK